MTAWRTESNLKEIQTVLIISQDVEMTQVWETLFRQKDYYVISETSPKNAIQTARLLSPSLIVLGLELPHIELLSLCRELRATTEGTLLLLASGGNEQEAFDVYNTGVDEWLTTPISPMAVLIKSMVWLVRREMAVPLLPSTQIYV